MGERRRHCRPQSTAVHRSRVARPCYLHVYLAPVYPDHRPVRIGPSGYQSVHLQRAGQIGHFHRTGPALIQIELAVRPLHRLWRRSNVVGPGSLRESRAAVLRQALLRPAALENSTQSIRTRRVIMITDHIDRIVIGCLTAGLVTALALVIGPLAGTPEDVITGTVLLAIASRWALLGTPSIFWAPHPPRWGLLGCAPADGVYGALDGIWPPRLLALLARTFIRVRQDLRSRSRVWVVYPVLGIYALCAFGGVY